MQFNVQTNFVLFFLPFSIGCVFTQTSKSTLNKSNPPKTSASADLRLLIESTQSPEEVAKEISMNNPVGSLSIELTGTQLCSEDVQQALSNIKEVSIQSSTFGNPAKVLSCLQSLSSSLVALNLGCQGASCICINDDCDRYGYGSELKPISIPAKDFAKLKNMNSLRTLNLSEARLYSPQPDEVPYETKPWKEAFYHLSSLQTLIELNLNNTEIEDDELQVLADIPHLEKLYLVRTGIKNLAFIKNLPHLRELDLTKTRINSTQLKNLSIHHKMEKLWLNGTWTSGAALQSVAHMNQLEVLEIQNTKTSDSEMVHISGLNNIRQLNLTHNDITHEGLAYLSNLPKLENLRVQGIKIGPEEMNIISNLNAVHTLAISEVKNEEDFSTLASLDALRHLDLSWSTDITGSGLRTLTNLETVDLRSSNATTKGLATSLGNLKNLKSLFIPYLKLSDEALSGLKGNTHLTSLDVSLNSKITDVGISYLSECTGLQTLNVLSTSVTDSSLDHLKGLPNLKEFVHVHTEITEDGLKNAEMQGLLPDTY